MNLSVRKKSLLTTILLFGSAILSLSLSLSRGIPGLDHTNPANPTNNTNLANRFSVDIIPQSSNTNDILALDVDTIPTNPGYLFLGYAWDSTATVPDYKYNSSTNTFTPSSITLTNTNPNRTLYAVWAAPTTYTLNYNATGGENAPASESRTSFNNQETFNINTTTIPYKTVSEPEPTPEPTTPTILSITNMQEMTSTICASMPINEVYTLTDSRDGNSYQITHTADGHCWMLDDLKYNDKAYVVQNGNYYYRRSDVPSACPSGWDPPTHADYYFGTMINGEISTFDYGPFPIGYIKNTPYLYSTKSGVWKTGSTFGYYTTGEYWGDNWAGAVIAFRVSSSDGKAGWNEVTGNASFVYPILCRFGDNPRI